MHGASGSTLHSRSPPPDPLPAARPARPRFEGRGYWTAHNISALVCIYSLRDLSLQRMASSSTSQRPGRDFKYIEFSVDAQLLRELGERLVGKPHVALGELVKNAYDADATRCVIKFGDDSIEISDDGNGMSYDEFVGKWMRIGSTHKRDEKSSPRLRRRLTGSKGIGRLAAQFLGGSIDLISEPRNPRAGTVSAKVNWEEAYSKGSLIEAGAWLKEGGKRGELPHGFQHGTVITIHDLKDQWSPEQFRELAAEL